MSENDEVYDVARKELDALVSDMTINAATIMQLLKISMEITEATQLKGEEQRKLCIKLVKDVIVAAPLGGKEEQLLLDMIDNGVLDNTVEMVVLKFRVLFLVVDVL